MNNRNKKQEQLLQDPNKNKFFAVSLLPPESNITVQILERLEKRTNPKSPQKRSIRS